MSQALIIQNEITINAPASEVWDALVNPAKTKQYMFGCETISDWEIGSPLLWQAEEGGQPIVYVTGIILAMEAGKRLVYTTFDPNGEYEDIPANHVAVSYQLSERQGQTLLQVEQGDYATVADGKARYEETMQGGGWSGILEEIKKMLEKE